jgi:hypothetical protein
LVIAMNNDLLIDQETGEINWSYVKLAAMVLARKDYGGDAPPTMYVRNAIRRLSERARAVRVNWRQHRGLPDDSAMVTVHMASWGASGDSYARG